MKARAFVLCAVMLSVVALPACDDDDPIGPEPGAVEVSVATSGDGTDDDGYEITLGDASEEVDVDDSVTFEDVAVGSHDVELTDLADGCEVDGPNPVEATVEASEVTFVEFDVVCEDEDA
ncbi:MAG: hypothetical protein ACOC83_01805 [Gemmatimonadota bacterium]